MPYEFLVNDLLRVKSQRMIGTDKGLAKIGDAIVNLTYSVAKSIYITKNRPNNQIKRTGLKVNRKILSVALKNADLKSYAKTRANAHDLADTVEAIFAYVWIKKKMSITEMIDFLTKNFNGDIENRTEEQVIASKAFTEILIYMKKFLPNDKK